MAEFFSEYKKQIIVLFVLGILMIIMNVFQKITNSNDIDRVVTNKEIVFTNDIILNKDSRQSMIPFINLNWSGIAEVNEEISKKIYQETIVNNRSASYEYYYDEDNLLSLLIVIEEYMTNGKLAIVKYVTYHVDLKNQKVLTEEDLIQKYNISLEDVKTIYEEKLKVFYNEAVKEGYTDDYCNFDCYIKEHELENGEDCFLVAEDGIYYYKDFLVSSILGDETFFEDKSLETLIEGN